MTWTLLPFHSADQARAQEVIKSAKKHLNPVLPPEQRGLYLATSQGGVAMAVSFWKEALAQTPRFASPADFPRTLSNAPASEIARGLVLRGPNHSFVGEDDAVKAALEEGAKDLEKGVIKEALIVAFDIAQTCKFRVLCRE